jgi:hypothetical protein
MTWLALEIGDAATWGSTAVTFCMACFAIAQGVAQRRDMRQQNELQAEASQLQRRQIETAERRTLVMEQLLMQLSASSAPAARSAADAEPEWEDTSAVPGSAAWHQAVPAAAAPPAGYGAPPPAKQKPAPASDNGAVARSTAPAAASVPSPWGAPLPAAAAPAPSEWRLERVGRHGFALRNITGRTLQGVRVDRANLPGSARGIPEDTVVRAGETAEFLMAPERGRPLPESLLVTWEGQPTPAWVPVPRG